MFIIVIAIFFTLSIIINSCKRIDEGEVSSGDVIKAFIPAAIAISCLLLRTGYFALPEEGMVSSEYLNYRKILLWGFLGLMGYIFRAVIYGSVYAYRMRS
mgnify:CR=1 FL=1|tara:strand:+ start:101831 stop:102130 length:300 start_codon:yes stop_codon:yes gene_type:complete